MYFQTMNYRFRFAVAFVIVAMAFFPVRVCNAKRKFWKKLGNKKTWNKGLKRTGKVLKDTFSVKRAKQNSEKIATGFKKFGKTINKDVIQPALELAGDFIDCVGDGGHHSDFAKCLDKVGR